MHLERVRINNRPEVVFDIGERPGDAIYFVLGIRKCGSSLMNSMMNSLARINHRQYLDVGGSFFSAGIPEREWRSDPALLRLLNPGNLYGGFRAMPLAYLRDPQYRSAKKILMVRDPRDALVSEYFSVAYSHSLPKQAANNNDGAREELLTARKAAQGETISDFVLSHASSINQTFMEYAEAASDPQTRLFRYEDVILNKREWLASMAEHFGWDGGATGFVEGMMSWADRIPAQENAGDFIRKVLPGDHKVKLSPAIIEQLDALLDPSMKLFDYAGT